MRTPDHVKQHPVGKSCSTSLHLLGCMEDLESAKSRGFMETSLLDTTPFLKQALPSFPPSLSVPCFSFSSLPPSFLLFPPFSFYQSLLLSIPPSLILSLLPCLPLLHPSLPPFLFPSLPSFLFLLVPSSLPLSISPSLPSTSGSTGGLPKCHELT